MVYLSVTIYTEEDKIASLVRPDLDKVKRLPGPWERNLNLDIGLGIWVEGITDTRISVFEISFMDQVLLEQPAESLCTNGPEDQKEVPERVIHELVNIKCCHVFKSLDMVAQELPLDIT